MLSTMQNYQLTIGSLLRYGRAVFGQSRVVTLEGNRTRTATFAQVAKRAEELAQALRALGVKPGDRVGTFCWNTQEHLEAYLAVPAMGAVLHTLNIRLFPEQLAYVINHAADKVILVDDSLVSLLAGILPQLKKVEHLIVIGPGDGSALGNPHRYEELLAAQEGDFEWPEIDENSAAAICYTSGTTGNPKGVVYSHRSNYLHSVAITTPNNFGLGERDRVLAIVPMFHANAWGIPYACWGTGADMLMPGRYLSPEPLCRFIAQEKPTFSAGVPTVWNAILQHADTKEVDLKSLHMVIVGGSAVPKSLIEALQLRHGVRIVQAWGMTEMSPLGAIGHPPRDVSTMEDDIRWRAKTGRLALGVDLRLVDDQGRLVPWDGESLGEIQVRGPWITGAYLLDPSAEKFHDGWLRTGDVGFVDRRGYIQITDRSKDVIKSGGEWISSVELELAIAGHPGVAEATVISIPDERWAERPLACVVAKQGQRLDPNELREWLQGKVAKFWLPERWAFIPEVPKTSVGKFDKKQLRAQYAEGKLEVISSGATPGPR